ncbi:MAG TPA: ABC transporter ATP-binding protein [Casimicrobiaceae bacterium]|jgi:simple sugar transport system ATP-binding protein
MTSDTPRLALSGVTKRYPGVVANDAVDLTVRPGEIHAVLGENGAGKSTLMRIIYGIVRPDAGAMRWEGEPVTIDNPTRARKLGIGMVFQHFSLFESLRVVDNIALGEDGPASGAALSASVRGISHAYGLPLDPARYVHTMSVGERQRVEIVRCLLQSPKLLIMDEPTSVLTPQAVERLFATLRALAAEGMSILYISHKLEEIRTLCDRATILRDGRVTGECDPRQESAASLARMMIGSDLPKPRHRAATPGAPMLGVRALDLAADDPFGTPLADVSFEVRRGEIVGIAGISGNGQRELLAALAGERAVRADAIVIDGMPLGGAGVAERRRHGLAYVPEERLGCGAVPELSLADNALLTGADYGLVHHGFVDHDATIACAQRAVTAFGVKAQGPRTLAATLSGGNLQKFILAREVQKAPKVLIAAQPTWGVDIGATAEIRQALIDLRDAGAAVLVVSEDLDELFEIADRIGVIARGRLSPPVSVAATDAAHIGVLMAGDAPARAAA